MRIATQSAFFYMENIIIPDKNRGKKEKSMKTILASKLIGLAGKVNCAATMGAAHAAGILASGDVSGLKPIFNTAVIGFGAVLALKGVGTLAEGQGEQSSASKSQGYGYIGGAVVLIVAGMATVEFLFGSL